MAIFDYKAKDREGNTISGAVEASSETLASDLLEERNLIVLKLLERKKVTLFKTSLGFLKRVTRKEVVIFSRQLAVMISANVPIVRALRILIKQTESVTFKIIISEITDEVEGGAKFSQVLSKYPQAFDDFFVYMVRSGETTGKLDETLNYLADQKEKDYDLMSRIRGAMIYPAFIIAGLLIVGVVMMIFVIPKLTAILEESGAELPITTRMLIGTSNILVNWWWALILGVGLIALGYKLYYRTPSGKRNVDLVKLKIPIFGGIYQRIYLTRFARSFSTLLVSGIPLARALEIVADVVGNEIYKDLTLKTIKEVEDGNSISTVYAKNKTVPVMLTQMMSVGEQTGKLDKILEKLSDFYAKELESLINNLISLIEPMIIALLGAAVAMLVVSILLPLYNLSTAI